MRRIWRIGAIVLLAGAPALAAREKALPYRAITSNYYVETDVSQEVADEIGDFMEIMYAAYIKVFSNIQPNWSGRLKVRILKSREDYIKEVGEKMSWSAGVYRGRSAGILTSLGRGSPAGIKGLLQHEGFHQFFDKFIGGGATWVNEGLATYFGSGIIEGDKIRFGAVRAGTIKGVRDAMAKGTALSLKDLVYINGAEWAENMGEKEKPPQYAQAMLLVHFLVHGYNGRNIPILNKYLMLQKNGVYGETALAQAFGTNFALFEEKWKEYVMNLKPWEPPSCTRNLYRLAMLAQYARNGPGVPTKIEEFRDLAVSGKIEGWKVPLPDGTQAGPKDANEIEKWFRCPEAKGGTIAYELEASGKEMSCPEVVCRRHGRYVLRARSLPAADGKGFQIEVEQARVGARKAGRQ